MTITKNHSYKIQLLRGLSIIAVVFIHNTPDALFQVWCRSFLNFGVGTFLFLSGMLSTAEKWKPKKRIIKVGIPYVIWTFIYVLIESSNNPSEIPLKYIKNLITAKSAPMMYYIMIYIQFTLLIPAIDKLARSKYKYFGFLISPIEILFMRLIPIIVGFKMNAYLSIIMGISCAGWFTYFYLGYLIGNDLIRIRLSDRKLLITMGGV